MSNRWVRQRYVVAGRYIRPVRGVEWEEYDPLQPREDGAELLHLHTELAGLDPADEQQVEAFVSRWGLLGLLTHTLAAVSFGGSEGQYAAVQDLIAVDYEETVSGLEKDIRAEGIVVQRGRWKSVDLRQYLRPFFPDLFAADGTQNPYGMDPLYVFASSSRWEYQCEPLDAFRDAVKRFHRGFDLALGWQQSGISEQELWGLLAEFRDEVRPAFPVPAYILSPSGEAPGSYSAASGAFEMAWAVPSLLSAAYLLLFQDLIAGHPLRYCANDPCRRPMVARHASRIYCSTRCLNAARHRAFRKRRARNQDA